MAVRLNGRTVYMTLNCTDIVKSIWSNESEIKSLPRYQDKTKKVKKNKD